MTDKTRSQLDPTPVIRHHKSDEILRIEAEEELKALKKFLDAEAAASSSHGATRKPDWTPTPETPSTVEEQPPNRLPEAPEARKAIPLTTGLLDYFPDALAAVAFVSKLGNDQHNPGQPMHWARGKSNDHADCIARHLVDRGSHDAKGVRHSAYLAWRALALLQEELEVASGLTYSRASR